ncbi:MAG: prepilin-type N-terminal cleavage/methylation domain-containing protein [Planctomycetota bacterium]|nr:prepilin-type N-terminal cleavage/methylation domain-containing protein [Planctomycetota bacterium]
MACVAIHRKLAAGRGWDYHDIPKRGITGGTTGRAFSLIELLVVIAIIALLISILLPSLGSARRAGKQVVCANNQRQLSIAILGYASDNKESWHAVWDNDALRFRPLFQGRNYLLRPFTVDASGTLQETQAYWAQLFDPYLNVETTDDMFVPTGGIGDRTFLPGWQTTRCPEAQFTLRAFRNNGALAHNPYTLYSSYCLNGVTPGFDNVPLTVTKTFFERRNGRREPRPLYAIEFPSKIIHFQDGSEVVMDGNGDTLIQLDQWNDEPPPDNQQWIREYFRHNKSCNVTWTDGHGSIISEGDARAQQAALRTKYGTTRGVPLPWYSTPGLY